MSDLGKENNNEAVAASAKQKSWVVVIALIVLILGLGLWAIFGHNKSGTSKVIFSVSGKNYTEQNLNDLFKYALQQKGSDKDTLAKQAFSDYKDQAAAQQLGISVDQASIDSEVPFAVGTKATDAVKNSDWAKLQAYDLAMQNVLNGQNQGSYTGYSFVFWCGQHNTTGRLDPTVNYGNTSLIAQDQSYAKSKANYYYQQLTSGAMTADQVLAAVKADPKLSPGNTPSTNISSHFGLDPSEPYYRQLNLNSIIKYVQAQSKTGLGSVQSGQIIADTRDPKSGQVTAYYYFVKIDGVNQKYISSNKSQFQAKLNTLSTHYYGW